MILTMSLPQGHSTSVGFKTVRQAVAMIRQFALMRGVSPLAVEWSARVPVS